MNKHRLLPATLLAGASLLWFSAAPAEIGTVAAVNRDMNGTPPSATPRALDLGARVVTNERIETSDAGSGQLLFMDQTSLTVAPGSDLVLDEYVYDPTSQQGEMALSLTRGALRFIGGRISKTADVEIRTPSATIGIRGGLTVIEVSDTRVTTVVQLAGEYTTVTDQTGAKRTLSRPNAAAQVPPEGGVTYLGLLEQEELEQVYKKFEGTGDGSSQTAGDDTRIDSNQQQVAEVNSGSEGGADRPPVSTSGEKHAGVQDGGGTQPPPSDPPPDTTGTETGTGSGTGTATGGGTGTGTGGGTTTNPLPASGSVFITGSGFSGFNSIARGSLIGTLPGGQTIRIPVAEDSTDFVNTLFGRSAPTFFAQSLSSSAGFVEFGYANGGTSSSTGALSGFGFSDLENNFHFYEFDTDPAAGPVQHGIILFADPSPGQAAVFAGDDGTLPAEANTIGVYRIEDDLNPVGGDVAPPEQMLLIANAGSARFPHASAGLPADGGGRVLVAEMFIEIDPVTGEQFSDFSVLAEAIHGGTTGGPRIDGQIFGTGSGSGGGPGFVLNGNIGTFEDADGNTVFGPNENYILVSTLTRAGGTGPLTFNPGTDHELGQPDNLLDPFVSLLTRDVAAEHVIIDPLALANDTTSRTGSGFGVAGAFDSVMATGFARCSTGNCGSSLTSSGFSGVYALTPVIPDFGLANHIDFQSGGGDTNSFGVAFGMVDFGGQSNLAGQSPFTDIAFEFGLNNASNQDSAYASDVLFGLATSGGTRIGGTTAQGHFGLASSKTAGDGGLLSGSAATQPEFARWGWWSAAFDTVDGTTFTGREDMVHLGTWVAGNLPNGADMPTTGTASFTGLAVGTDANLATGQTTVVGGDFSLSYDFGQSSGAMNLNIAGHAFNNISVAGNFDIGNGEHFDGLQTNSGTDVFVQGAFYSGGGQAVAATGGQFQINDFIGDRQVVGSFAGDRGGAQPPPPTVNP